MANTKVKETTAKRNDKGNKGRGKKYKDGLHLLVFIDGLGSAHPQPSWVCRNSVRGLE